VTVKRPVGPLIGYARVSTQGQDLTQQRAALREAGCTRIFEEKISGAKRDRPELGRLLDHLRAGDVVTVTRLDRLARSTRDLLEIAERIKVAGAGLRSLAEPWADTTTAGRAHGTDCVRWHRRLRAVLDRGAHQRRPDCGQGARCPLRAASHSHGRADRSCPPANRGGGQTRGRGCPLARGPSCHTLPSLGSTIAAPRRCGPFCISLD
jgi:hypothetical protein